MDALAKPLASIVTSLAETHPALALSAAMNVALIWLLGRVLKMAVQMYQDQQERAGTQAEVNRETAATVTELSERINQVAQKVDELRRLVEVVTR